MNINAEIRKDGLLAIWRDLTTKPVWKYQVLPPFLLPELIKLDLVEASDSALSRVICFWLRRPSLALHEGTALIVVAFCALLALTIAFVDWPLTSVTKGAAEVMILLVVLRITKQGGLGVNGLGPFTNLTFLKKHGANFDEKCLWD